MSAGLESIGFYTSHYYIDLKTLAEQRGIDPNKYYIGLGQEKMSIAPPDEDVVTLGAGAARLILDNGKDLRDRIDTLLFATETGIDQSKAGGVYIHHLLDLPRRCRVVELKQACYSGTAAVQFATALVEQRPDRRVLIIASDIARYGLGTPGEPTQGCGAVAMIVSSEPRLLALDREYGVHVEDVMDFWRPNYTDEAIVDGKFSTRMYLSVLMETFQQYVQQSGRTCVDLDRFCYHLPFTRMAEKAHIRLAKACGVPHMTAQMLERQIGYSMNYNRVSGNSYAASLYVGLSSLLDTCPDDLAGQRVGMYSYGSGCVGEYFSGMVAKGYRDHLHAAEHEAMLKNRTELSYPKYEAMYQYRIPTDGGEHTIPKHKTGHYRLAAVSGHKRIYETVP